MSINNIVFFLFSIFIFFLPYLKLGIPFGIYLFSISDIALIASVLLLFLKIPLSSASFPFNKAFKRFIIIQWAFIILLSFSGFKALSLGKYVFAFLPHIYAVLLTFVFGYCYSVDPIAFVTRMRKIILASLIISFVPLLFSLAGKTNYFFFYPPKSRYTFLCRYPNQYGFFVSMYLAIYLMLSMRFTNMKKSRLLFVVVLCFFAVLFTASRSAFVFVFLTAFSFILYLFFNSFRKIAFKAIPMGYKYIAIITCSCLFFAAVAISYKGLANLQRNYWVIDRAFSVIENINEGRIGDETGITIEKGMRSFSQNPFLGVGFGNFHEHYDAHEVHNTYVSVLAETGVIGFIGYLLLITFIGYNISKISVGVLKKTLFFSFFFGYLLINIPHYLLRERWMWLFFLAIIALTEKRNVEGGLPKEITT